MWRQIQTVPWKLVMLNCATGRTRHWSCHLRDAHTHTHTKPLSPPTVEKRTCWAISCQEWERLLPKFSQKEFTFELISLRLRNCFPYHHLHHHPWWWPCGMGLCSLKWNVWGEWEKCMLKCVYLFVYLLIYIFSVYHFPSQSYLN